MSNSVREVVENAQRVAGVSGLQQQIATDIERQASSPAIASLQAALQALTLHDLGVSPTYFTPSLITYCDVHSTEKVSLVMYCFAAGSALPLHSLPIAFGFSQVVSGHVLYRSFESRGLLPDGTTSADVSIESDSEGTASFLNTKNSYRELRAVDDSVVVDLLFAWERSRWRFFEETDRRSESVVLKEMKDAHVMMREKGYRGAVLR